MESDPIDIEILITNGLQNIFKMTDEELKATGISGNRAVMYEKLYPKDGKP